MKLQFREDWGDIRLLRIFPKQTITSAELKVNIMQLLENLNTIDKIMCIVQGKGLSREIPSQKMVA